MSFSSWHNAVRAIPIPQEIINAGKTRCTCPENPDVNEFGDNSWLPCMSFEPDCDLCCKDCIYCQVIKDEQELEKKGCSINFGIIDLCFNSKHKDDVIKILESNKTSVLNYTIDESQETEIYIHIDNYDNKTIGNVLNQLAEI